MARKASARNGGESRRPFTELLEARRLLSTTLAYQFDWAEWESVYTADGVSATHSAGSGSSILIFPVGSNPFGRDWTDSLTVTLSDLPAHTMIAADMMFTWGVYQSGTDEDTLQLGFAGSSGGSTFTETNVINFGDNAQWKQHTSSSVSLTFSTSGFEPEDFLELEQLNIRIYNPTVTIGGGGPTAEGELTPSPFVLNRDLPSDYNALYDHPVPATTVNLTTTGTATAGQDYLLPTSAQIPVGASSFTVPWVLVDDSIPEWTENAILHVVTGAGYTPGTPSSASAEIADNDWAITGVPENLVVNNDDDDDNGLDDFNQTGSVAGEDDLYPIQVVAPSAGPSDATVSITCPASVRIWENPDKSGAPASNGNGTYFWLGQVPSALYLEAIAPSVAIGDIVLQLSATNPATTSQSPVTPASSLPGTGWRLDGLSVVSGATQEGVDAAFRDKSWIAIRTQGEKVVLQASVAGPPNTPVPAGLLHWTDGDPVPGDTTRRTVARDDPASKLVRAAMGDTEKMALVCVIWATVDILVDGPAPSAAPRFPEYPDNGGQQQLGWYEFTPQSGIGAIGGRVVIVATLQPPGVGQILTRVRVPNDETRFKIAPISIRRSRETRLFTDGQLNANPNLGVGTTSGPVDDTSFDVCQNTDAGVDGLIYDTDFPTMQAFYDGATSSAELYHKFRQWVTFNGTPISDDVYWRFSIVWVVDLPYDQEVTPPFPNAYRILGVCSDSYILPESAQVL